MEKVFKKHETLFTIALIIIYVVANSYTMQNFGYTNVHRQMSGQVLRGSAGEYQADERAGVAGLSWRVSGR